MPTHFRLTKALEERGVSQSELARLSGVSFVTINRMCNKKNVGVSLATLDALAEALKVHPGDLLERDGKKRKR